MNEEVATTSDGAAPVASASLVSSAAPATSAVPAQEIDAWWGGYSGWTMLPSTTLCLGLTAAIVCAVLMFLDPQHVQWSIWAGVGVVWLIQGVRCGRRVFGFSYRLTTRRILVVRGFFLPWRCAIELRAIQGVAVKRKRLAGWLGIGDVIIVAQNHQRLVLEGIRRPEGAAALIRQARAHVLSLARTGGGDAIHREEVVVTAKSAGAGRTDRALQIGTAVDGSDTASSHP